MNWTITFWLSCSLVFYCAAEYLSKKWTLTQAHWMAALAVLGYALNALFWFPALKNHGSLAVLGSIYAVAYVLATVAIGWLGFHEAITLRQWVGIGLALVSITLLSL